MDAAELMSVVNNCSTVYLDPCESVYFAYVYILTPICIAGVILNCLNLAVFLSKPFYGSCVSQPCATAGARSTTTAHVGSTMIYLIALSAADVLCLSLATGIGPARCVPVTGGEAELLARQVFEVVLMPLVNTFAAASVWTTALIAVKRFLYVRRRTRVVVGPTRLRLSNASGCRRTWLVVATIYVAALAANLPYFFCKKIDPNRSRAATTEFGASYSFEVYLWVRMVIVKLLPIVLTTVSNVALLITIYIATRKLRRSCAASDGNHAVAPSSGSVAGIFPSNTERARRRRRQEHRVTAMLFAISTTFVLCQVTEPFIHSAVYAARKGPCSIYESDYNVRVVVVNILEMFSYGVGFVFFCAFEHQFRAALRSLFRRPMRFCISPCCRRGCCCCCRAGGACASNDPTACREDEETFAAVAYSIRID